MIVIKHIYSRDLLVDGKIFDLWDLPKQSSVSINIRVTIGFSENEFEEVFDSAIITGSAAEKFAENPSSIPYGGKVFKYDEFDPAFVKADLHKKIYGCNREDFRESISELSKIMEWDFEGM
ncbi:Imm8 family immunity protein [Mesorhizobium sp. M0207]|uniref:Imm8 family immunity protein n=1 Tax=Mesorhizobium sp. M0207 TaxID=2956915 RepID=UPI003335013C